MSYYTPLAAVDIGGNEARRYLAEFRGVLQAQVILGHGGYEVRVDPDGDGVRVDDDGREFVIPGWQEDRLFAAWAAVAGSDRGATISGLSVSAVEVALGKLLTVKPTSMLGTLFLLAPWALVGVWLLGRKR